tara:strand:+ start:353 stop:1036 length:684 start_codon:yes stop_codon:yes gene_type:complete
MNLKNKKHPKYNPDKWNKNIYIRKSHNCYAYALNILKPSYANLCKKYLKKTKKHNCHGLRPQPGQFSGYIDEYKKHPYKCKKIERRMKKDNKYLKKIRKNQKCPDGYYKIALVNDGEDYHFYRQDKIGLWSHKDGWRKARNTDVKNRLIKDPKTAKRGKYKKFCGYYIVPNNRFQKKLSNKTRKYKNKISKYQRILNITKNKKTKSKKTKSKKTKNKKTKNKNKNKK